MILILCFKGTGFIAVDSAMFNRGSFMGQGFLQQGDALLPQGAEDVF
jgi:hypothetical protein